MFATTPDWNGYDGHARLIQAAWDAVVEVDPLDLSLKEIAAVAGLSPSLFHRHFKSRSALFGWVAEAGLTLLLVNLSDESDTEGLVGSWLRLAQARPRHYQLMFSPQFAARDGVDLRKNALAKVLREIVEPRSSRTLTKSDIFAVFAMIHGAASLIASGVSRPPNQTIVDAVDGYLK